MIEDLSVSLDDDDQTRLSAWALKTAMVADAARGTMPFYRPEDCAALKKKRTIPNGTGIWMGRYFGRSLSAITGGTTINAPDGTHMADFHVFTMLIGHVIFQVLSIHEQPGKGTTQIQLAASDWHVGQAT